MTGGTAPATSKDSSTTLTGEERLIHCSRREAARKGVRAAAVGPNHLGTRGVTKRAASVKLAKAGSGIEKRAVVDVAATTVNPFCRRAGGGSDEKSSGPPSQR